MYIFAVFLLNMFEPNNTLSNPYTQNINITHKLKEKNARFEILTAFS